MSHNKQDKGEAEKLIIVSLIENLTTISSAVKYNYLSLEIRSFLQKNGYSKSRGRKSQGLKKNFGQRI